MFLPTVGENNALEKFCWRTAYIQFNMVCVRLLTKLAMHAVIANTTSVALFEITRQLFDEPGAATDWAEYHTNGCLGNVLSVRVGDSKGKLIHATPISIF